MGKNSFISHFNLSNNPLGDECMKNLNELLIKNPNIRKIILDCCDISDKGVVFLFKSLAEKDLPLEKIGLQCNARITEKSTSILCDYINSSKICSLDIEETRISSINSIKILLAKNKMLVGKDNLDFAGR